jgi:hypothetical protein
MIMVETLVADKQPVRLSPSLAGPPQPPTQAGVPAEPPRPLMRELPPADPFPVDALGPVLGSAARAIHDRVRAPLAENWVSMLRNAQQEGS